MIFHFTIALRSLGNCFGKHKIAPQVNLEFTKNDLAQGGIDFLVVPETLKQKICLRNVVYDTTA